MNAGTFPDGAVASGEFTVVKQSSGLAGGDPSAGTGSTEGWTVADAATGAPVRAGDHWEALGAAARAALPEVFALHAAYPNPFTSRATLGYDLPEPSRVRLVVYDVLGRTVAVLVNEEREAGSHAAVFEASALASGTYLVCFEAGAFVQTRRLALMR